MNRPNKPPGLALALLTALGAAASVPAHAAVTFINSTTGNGSFETPALPGNSFEYRPTEPGTIWTFASASGIINPPSGFTGPAPAPAGSQYAFIQAATDQSLGSENGYFYQPVTLTTGTTYDYSFQVAGRPAGGTQDGDTSDTFGFLQSSTPTTAIFRSLTDFRTTSGSGFGAPISGSFVFTGRAGTYNIGFINNSDPTGDHTAFIDNVNFSAAPEPAQVCTLGFFGLGLLSLALRARKRGQSAV